MSSDRLDLRHHAIAIHGDTGQSRTHYSLVPRSARICRSNESDYYWNILLCRTWSLCQEESGKNQSQHCYPHRCPHKNRLPLNRLHDKDAGKIATWSAARWENGAMNDAQERSTKVPKLKSEDAEANWWASAEGREFLKRRPAAGTSMKRKGSPLVAKLKPGGQRSDRAALARAGSRQSAPDCRPQRDRLPNTFEDDRA